MTSAGPGSRQWVRQLADVGPAPGPFPWGRAARAAVGITGPVAVALALGSPSTGLVVASGALSAAVADRGGPYRPRARRVALVGAAASGGWLLGGLADGDALLTVVVVTLAALASGLGGSFSNTASVAGLQAVTLTAVASGLPPLGAPVWVPPLLSALGSALVLLLSQLGRLRVRPRPERELVAVVYDRLAALLAAAGTPAALDARGRLTGALDEAYDAVLASRSHAPDRETAAWPLLSALNASSTLAEAALALVRAGTPAPLGAVAAARGVAEALRAGTRYTPPPAPGAPTQEERLLVRALAAVEDAVVAPSRPGDAALPGAAWRRRAQQVLRQRGTWLEAARVTLVIGAAQAVAFALPLSRTYWVPLTAAVVLKPDIGSVFARGVHRAAGTLAGVALAAAVLLPDPPVGVLLAVVALLAASLPVLQPRSFALFSVALTPLVLVLLDLVQGPGQEESFVAARALDTLVGCAVALVVGYAAWPTTWRVRPRVARAVTRRADEVAAFVRAALDADGPDPAPGRRRTYRSLAALRATLSQALGEPPAVSAPARAALPVVVALERVTDAAAAVRALRRVGAPAADAQDRAAVLAALDELVAARRERRPPALPPLPDDGPLADLAGEVRVAAGVVADRARRDPAGPDAGVR